MPYPTNVDYGQVTTLNAQGPVASGSSNGNNPVKIGAPYNATQPTVTNGQMVDGQATARGGLIVSTGVDAFKITVDTITAALSQSNQVPVSNAAPSGALTITESSLTANSDNTVTFSATARRIRIQNESSGTIYWRADAAASTASSSLAAPASNAVSVEWIAVQCSVLHIFVPSGGTTTLNGSGGVKVMAWT